MYTAIFWHLAEEVLDKEDFGQLRALIDASAPDFGKLLDFDRSLNGPGMYNVNRGKTGAYHPEDRDVFRPYQYCWMYFSLPEGRLAWMTREIVHMCGLHLEALIERVARRRKLTLGQGLKNPAVREVLDWPQLDRLGRFLAAYNASKHDLSLDRDGEEDLNDEELGAHDAHLFSVEDAIVAYVACRRLASPLYAHAGLKTPRSLWGPFAGKSVSPPVPET